MFTAHWAKPCLQPTWLYKKTVSISTPSASLPPTVVDFQTWYIYDNIYLISTCNLKSSLVKFGCFSAMVVCSPPVWITTSVINILWSGKTLITYYAKKINSKSHINGHKCMAYKIHSKEKNLRFGLLCINCLYVAVYIMVVGNEEVSIVWWPSLTKCIKAKKEILH